MIVNFIAAVAEDNAIGAGNALPWYLPGDLQFFKSTTLGKPVIMGRKTFESLGKPLPGRRNIILTRNKDWQPPVGAEVYSDVDAALEALENDRADEVFIIGGGSLFASAMPLADGMYITRVHMTAPGADTFFPSIDHTHWRLVWEEAHPADERNQYAYTFQKFERMEM